MSRFNKVQLLSYDEPTSREIKDFLDHICTIQRSNPQMIITEDIVYHELEMYGLKPNDVDPHRSKKSTKAFFDKWSKKFRNIKNVQAFCSPDWPYFFQFINGKINRDDGFIKLYIPLDYEHLYEGANQIFEFLAKENIIHMSKIGGSMRSDNVIIRLRKNDMDNALKIIKFIKENKYLQKGLNKVNPFVPTINGIGIMMDDGRSYNSDMAELISQYVINLKNTGRDYGSLEGFTNYVLKHASSNVTLDTYTACISKNRKFNKNEKKEYSYEQKISLFNDACKATVSKYSINQLIQAIQGVLNYNNYGWFTNGFGNTTYREDLKEHVSSEDMKKIIISTLSETNGMYYGNIDNNKLANIYAQSIFSYLEAINIDQICSVTLENYDEEQLLYAINIFLRNGEMNYFSQYKRGNTQINYRMRLQRYSREEFLNAIRRSLEMKGIEYNDENIIDVYVSHLRKYIYGNEDEKTISH